jgi:hypothetical protein
MATDPAELPASVNSAPLIVDQPPPARRPTGSGEESDEKTEPAGASRVTTFGRAAQGSVRADNQPWYIVVARLLRRGQD